MTTSIINLVFISLPFCLHWGMEAVWGDGTHG